MGPEVVSDGSVSPDGSAILYGVRDSEAPSTEDWTLMRLDLADSTTRPLGKGAQFARLPLKTGNPRWKLSPDGGKLALGEWNPSLMPMVRDIAVPSGLVREITLEGVIGYGDFAFTADGKGLFIKGRQADGGGEFMRADFEGRTVAFHSDYTGDGLADNPVPSPDGRYFGFNVSSTPMDL